MELSFLSLKQKDVISVSDGRNLGKVCDVSLSFPDCSWLGITVPGCKGFKLTNKGEQFIPINNIVQIGEDAVLVKTEDKRPPSRPPKEKCPPPCPSPCPPQCPPPCQPPKPRPSQPNPHFESGDRRDYGEYE